jgi:ketosteroid isomerase-like protein
MKTLILSLCSGVLTLLPATRLCAEFEPAASESEQAAIVQAVLETNARMTQAANSLNVDAFFEFIVDTDKGLIVQNGSIFRTRREAIEAVKRGQQGVAKIDRRMENPQVTVIAPDAALLVADGSVAATLDDGRVIDSRFAVSVVFVRRDGKWKVLHGHYSMPSMAR